jgi:hypothetical protein
VSIATTQPVTITGSTINFAVTGIRSGVAGVDVTVTHTKFSGSYPPAGAVDTYAFYADNSKRVDLEHNSVNRGAGFKLNGWGGGSTNPVTIRYNQFTNMIGLISDGSGGYTGGYWDSHAVQLAGVNNAPNVDVAWNEFDNAPNVSSIEDNISIFASSGTSSSPINVHDNYVNGGYPNPATTPGYTGGGIMLGDGGGNYEVSQNNIVIRTTNYAVAISGGTNLTVRNNVGVSACELPDGTTMPTCNVGMYVNGTPANANDQAYGNTLGWWGDAGVIGYPYFRNDWWIPDCTVNCSNYHYGSTTLTGPDDGGIPGPRITPSDESAQTTVWQNKLAANGVTIGA